MSHRWWLLTILALAVACGPGVKKYVIVELDPLPSDTEVKVFADDLPTCEYEQVGLIASQDLEETLKEARRMGADGVIGTVLAQEGRSQKAAICGTPNCLQYNTVAIRFTYPGCRE